VGNAERQGLIARRPLADGLVLRTATPEDAAELAEFNAVQQAEDDLPGDLVHEWTLELFESPPPRFRAEDDIAVVEDTGTGRIVSSVLLIPQDWSYAGAVVPVGQPELVATDPAYRRRGLIREQFAEIHRRSEAVGDLWQLIGGIPWYYRQFGYAYALDLPPVPVWRPPAKVPEPPAEIALRPATLADLPFLARVDSHGLRDGLGCVRDEAAWRYELTHRPGSLSGRDLLVVERATAAGRESVGFVAYASNLRYGSASIWAFELAPGESWLAPTAAVLLHLDAWARAHPDGPGGGVRLLVPDGHPARCSAATGLTGGRPSGYGFYVRLTDPARALTAVRTVLESRLARSPAVGHTGEVVIDLYRGQLHLGFEDGRLERVVADGPRPDDAPPADVSLPAEWLLHLVLGNRTLAELEATVPDCLLGTDTGALVVDALFPRLPLSPWTMG
jgi:Acetyltransferase (GNAT) domain